MSELGCKHGHIASSCTACHRESELERLRSRIAQLEAALAVCARAGCPRSLPQRPQNRHRRRSESQDGDSEA